MKNKFKVGDVIEGTDDGRNVIGRIVHIDKHDRLGVDVYEKKSTGTPVLNLHFCNGYLDKPNGWYVNYKRATLAKSYVINKILSEI
jgi:hypothetical protein